MINTKILFLDLDGTLLNDQKEVTPGNRQAIEQAIAARHKVVIASGRPLKSTLAQAERLGLDGEGCYVIAYNGALVYDCARKTESFRKTLEMEDLFTAVDEANRRGVYIQTYEHEDVIVERPNDGENVRRYCNQVQLKHRVVEDLRKGLSEPPVKTLMIDFEDRAPLEAMQQWIRTNMQGRVDCFFSNAYYLEVVPAGMNKGSAIRDLCRQLGIPMENSVAAGDQGNDISMLQAAAVGVAMQNAAAEVKAVADYITERDNNHDGIAEIIHKFIFDTYRACDEKDV